MADFPATGDFDEPITGAELIDAQEALLAAAKQLPGAEAVSEVTITGGVIVPTGSQHRVDTESNAAADDLTTIQQTGVRDGAVLILYPENIARVVTAKHLAGGVGQVQLVGEVDYVMDHAAAALVVQRRGTLWQELLRVSQPAPANNQQLFTADGTFTVPDGVETVWVTAVGGGGGGGGGAGTNGDNPNTGADGANGVAGASTTFGATLVVVTGGAAGQGGHANGLGGRGGLGSQNGQTAFAGAGGDVVYSPFSLFGNYGTGGAGAGGADDSNAAAGGGGGGAGGISAAPAFRKPIDVSALSAVAVVIGTGGAGGTGGTGTDNNGGNGGAGTDGALLVEW